MQLAGAQLTAGGIDVEPACGPDGGRDAGGLQNGLERLGTRLRRWCQRAAIDGVHRDQVDVAEVATYHGGQALGLLRTVVDALQQDVLVARAPAGSFRVSPCGADDRGDRVLAIARE